MYTHTYIHIHTLIHEHMYIYIYVHTCTCIHIYIHRCTQKEIYLQRRIKKDVEMNLSVFFFVSLSLSIYRYIFRCIHMFISECMCRCRNPSTLAWHVLLFLSTPPPCISDAVKVDSVDSRSARVLEEIRQATRIRSLPYVCVYKYVNEYINR